MKTTHLALAGIALVTLLILALAVFSLNDPRAINKRLSALATAASVDPTQSMLRQQVQGANLRDFFAPDVVLQPHDSTKEGETIRGRAELMEFIKAARATLRPASFRFTRVQIEVDGDRTTAIVHTLLEADLNDEVNAMSNELTLVFKKLDRHWVISEIDSAALPSAVR